MSESSAPNPIDELAYVLEKFGWETKFCDLSEDQVHVLIFAIQEAKPLSKEINVGSLEENTLSQQALSHLQVSPSDPTAEAIKNAVDAAILRDEKKRERRKYLGASSIGDECSRKIQYRFMNYPVDDEKSSVHKHCAYFNLVTK